MLPIGVVVLQNNGSPARIDKVDSFGIYDQVALL